MYSEPHAERRGARSTQDEKFLLCCLLLNPGKRITFLEPIIIIVVVVITMTTIISDVASEA